MTTGVATISAAQAPKECVRQLRRRHSLPSHVTSSPATGASSVGHQRCQGPWSPLPKSSTRVPRLRPSWLVRPAVADDRTCTMAAATKPIACYLPQSVAAPASLTLEDCREPMRLAVLCHQRDPVARGLSVRPRCPITGASCTSPSCASPSHLHRAELLLAGTARASSSTTPMAMSGPRVPKAFGV